MVDVMDAGIGKVISALEENGLRDNTLIFFLSDNGGPQPRKNKPGGWNGSDNAPFRGGKGNMYDGGVHVPFVVSWPKKIAAGSTCDHPIISLDIAATAVSIAGVPKKHRGELEGTDLTSVFAGKESSPPHDFLYWKDGGRWSILSSNHLKHLQDQTGGPKELFSLQDDIAESNDLASSLSEQASALRSEWKTWNESNQPNRMEGYKKYHDLRDQFFLESIPQKATSNGFSPEPVPTFKKK